MQQVQRFVAGVRALPRFAAAGKLVTIILCLLVTVMSSAALIEKSAALLSHQAVPGVVTACRVTGTRAQVCTVEYVLAGQLLDAQVDAPVVGPPRQGAQVHLWATRDGVHMAGKAFVHDILVMAAVLVGCLIVLAGLFTVISRVGEAARRGGFWEETFPDPPGGSA